MAYGLKYTTAFDSFKEIGYTLEIEENGYSGAVTEVLAAAVPVVHKWEGEDPKAEIRGSSLSITLYNTGNLPISSFYSTETNRFRVTLKQGAAIKFIGFIVQDDCREIQVDFNHAIELSANDGLGLLKEVPFDRASLLYGTQTINTPVTVISQVPGDVRLLSISYLGYSPVVGDSVLITGTNSPLDDEIYQILTVANVGGFLRLGVDSDLPTSATYTGGTATYTARLIKDLDTPALIAYIVGACLNATGLQLNERVYGILFETYQDTERPQWITGVFLNPNTFLASESYESAYDVLTKIFNTFGATLMQVDGKWNIVRWNELRYMRTTLGNNGYEYNYLGVYQNDVNLPANLTIGDGSDIETGWAASILSPLKYSKRTFKYEQPENLLRNAAFTEEGPVLRPPYIVGLNTVYEYGMAQWDVGHEWTTGGAAYVASSAERFIRVVHNALGVEIERYGVIKGNSGFDDYACAESYPIDIHKGDRVEFEMEYRTNLATTNMSHPFRVNLVVSTLFVPRDPNNQYLNGNGKWNPYGTPNYLLTDTVAPIDSTLQWRTVNSGRSDEAPFDGVLYVKLAQQIPPANPNPNKETHYKGLSFNIVSRVNGGTKVIGHTHTQTQPPTINNKIAEDWHIDDSPASTIKGTLQLGTFTGRLRNLTTLWQEGGRVFPVSLYRLGDIITRDELQHRHTLRTILEGSPLLADGISPLQPIKYGLMPSLNFIFGLCEVDYKNDRCNVTLEEQYYDGEQDADFNPTYEFKYLYDTR